MLKLEGIDPDKVLSRQEWEDELAQRFNNRWLQFKPDGSVVKPERIAVWVTETTPLEVRVVTGQRVLTYPLKEFILNFREL